jgi:glutamyl-tRNA synthetase
LETERSKRDGDKLGFPVFPLGGKLKKVFHPAIEKVLPKAVVNFFALLGWNDGTDKELYTLEELVEAFDLNRVHKAGQNLIRKNRWFNHQHYQEDEDGAYLRSIVASKELRYLKMY